jgi:hypothetical protein
MNIQVSMYPTHQIFNGQVDPQQSIADVINHITSTSSGSGMGKTLVVDKNQNFHRIAFNDVVNKYYDGQLGEIYRIVDGSSVRYRIVQTLPTIAIEKKHGVTVTGSIYSSAYNTILQMLTDRGCDSDMVAKSNLSRDKISKTFQSGSLIIPSLSDKNVLVNKRGRAVYTIFIEHTNDVMIKNSHGALKDMLSSRMNDILKHYNAHSGQSDLTFDSGDMDEDIVGGPLSVLTDNIELIIIYNNEDNAKHIVPKLNPSNMFFQAFPVQNLTFNVTMQESQPSFTLLQQGKDDDEIRSIYSINGRQLEADKSLASYGLRDGIRLILV